MVQFFVLRKLIEHAWVRKGYDHKHAYICSLSSQSIVYKGQLLPAQVLQHFSRPHHSLVCQQESSGAVFTVPQNEMIHAVTYS